MKKIALAALFIMGVVELLFPIDIATMFYAFSPQTDRVFATPDQHQFYQQLHAAVYAKGQTVFIWGS